MQIIKQDLKVYIISDIVLCINWLRNGDLYREDGNPIEAIYKYGWFIQ